MKEKIRREKIQILQSQRRTIFEFLFFYIASICPLCFPLKLCLFLYPPCAQGVLEKMRGQVGLRNSQNTQEIQNALLSRYMYIHCI